LWSVKATEVLSGWFGFTGGEGCDRGMFESSGGFDDGGDGE